MISNYLEVLILSIVQGISEFLPVSSSAHLIVFSNIIDFSLWETISTSSTNWKSIVTFDNDIYAINSSNSLYYDFNGVTFESQFNLAESILDHRVSENKMLITSNSASRVYERPFNNILTKVLYINFKILLF